MFTLAEINNTITKHCISTNNAMLLHYSNLQCCVVAGTGVRLIGNIITCRLLTSKTSANTWIRNWRTWLHMHRAHAVCIITWHQHLFFVKWCHGRHLQSTTWYRQKSDSVNRFVYSLNKKVELSQRLLCNARHMGALKVFGSPWLRPKLLSPKFLMGFCCDRSCEWAYKIWSSYSFTRPWDNKG